MAEEEVTLLMDSIIADPLIQIPGMICEPVTVAAVDQVAAPADPVPKTVLVATAVTAEVMAAEVEAPQVFFHGEILSILIGLHGLLTVAVVVVTLFGLVEECTPALVQAEQLDLYTQVVQDHIHQQM